MNRFFLSCQFDHVLKGVHPHGKIERKNYLVAEIVTAISSFCSLWDPKYKNEMPIKKASCTHDEQEKKSRFYSGVKQYHGHHWRYRGTKSVKLVDRVLWAKSTKKMLINGRQHFLKQNFMGTPSLSVCLLGMYNLCMHAISMKFSLNLKTKTCSATFLNV